MKQSIPLSSILNVCELGGYWMADGMRVKEGVLLRTANTAESPAKTTAF